MREGGIDWGEGGREGGMEEGREGGERWRERELVMHLKT